MSKETTNNQAIRLANQRLAVIELAEKLKNVREACRRSGMDRVSFYKWRNRYLDEGFEGLMNRSKKPHSHPATTSDSVVEVILDKVLELPNWGCDPISRALKSQGISVSGPAVQKIFSNNNLASAADRVNWLEKKYVNGDIEPNNSQLQLMLKYNPELKDRSVYPTEPGDLFDQDVNLINVPVGFGRIYLYCVIDQYCSFGFANLHVFRNPETAVKLLCEYVLPQYREWGIDIGTIRTNRELFRGRLNHPYVSFLKNNSIEHWKEDFCITSGTVQRFVETIKKEFLPENKKEGFRSIQKSQRELDVWLRYYNYERPHLGFRNRGERPFDRIKPFVEK